MIIDLTVGVGDPHEPGYLRLYRTVYGGWFSIQVEEQRILANCSTDLLIADDSGGQKD